MTHLSFLLLLSPSALAATFTTNALITEADIAYDGQNIVVSGATLTVNGRHYFNSLLLTNGAVLTHSPCTTTNTHKLDLVVTNEIVVSTNSRIDVSGKGYRPGYTTGNTTNAAPTECSGGSYGGLGGSFCGGKANEVYGDFADPDDWGSGSSKGASLVNGSFVPPGGGLFRLTASTLLLDGRILANGIQGDWGSGGSSGGGISIAVSNLTGTGLIEASGGDGSGGFFQRNYYGAGGGGGRIAVYALGFSTFPTNNVRAAGGRGSEGAPSGSPGTVHLVQGVLGTHVRNHSPAGRFGGYVPGSLDRITFQFNKPLDLGSFNAAKFPIFGPTGPVAPTGIIEISNRTYQITFPVLTENGLYDFALSPTLTDANGLPLDQNANGIPGETNDGYSFTLIVDTVAPRIAQHRPSGDVAGTVASIDLWFSERPDPATWTPADVHLTNSLGQTIPITAIQEVGLNRFQLSFPPQTAPATYHALISTNVTDLAGNPLIPAHLAEQGFAYDASFNLVPVDLALSDVTASTNEFWAGDAITVSWTGRNTIGAPLLGDWMDGLYLSPDPLWSITDVRLATVAHTNGLGANGIYAASASVTVPGLLPGNYYLLVRADIANTSRETVETNNLVAFGPLPLHVRELSVGGLGLSGTLIPNSRRHYFAVHVAAGESLRLTLNGQGGINHLFVSHASIPSRLGADFSGTQAGSSQTITLTGVPGGGTYYVLISGEQAGGAVPYTLTAETAPFYLTSITPSQVVGGRSPRFWVEALQSNLPSAVLTGVGFDRETTVQLIGSSSGIALNPTRTEFISSVELKLQLPLTHWPADTYSVRVTKGTATRTLTNAFVLVGDGEARLEARIVGTALSPGGGQTLYVEYANLGSRAMPTPLLKVTAYTEAVIVTHKLNYRPQDWLNRPPSSYEIGSGGGAGGPARLIVPSYRFRVSTPLHTVQMMAVGPGSNPGLLQPGERGVVPVYFAGLRQDRGESQIQFSVGSLTADDTAIIDLGSPADGVPNEYKFPRSGQRVPNFPPGHAGDYLRFVYGVPFAPNWNDLEQSSQPETADAGGWHAVWQNVVQNAGPLWADYVLMLGDNMNHFAKIGQMTNDPAVLFNFEVMQATASLNPVRTLAGAVDASAPSPGFPLVFRRVYGQPILSRYKLGPLGRGWSHNWDISIQTLTNFQGVVIHGPGGANRFFGRFNDGSYIATGSDTGRLIQTNGNFRLTEADGTVWQFRALHFDNFLDFVQDPNGNRITCGYTGAQLTSLTHTSGKQLLLQYNGAGRLSQITDPLGPGAADDRVTTYEYDGSGEHLIRVTAPGNRVTTYAYHTTGIPQRLHALTNVTHPDLTQDSFVYDAQGRLIQTSQNCCGGAQQVTYAYDSAGTVTVTDATGRATQLLYGFGGQLAQVRDGEGRIVNFTYDDLAQLTQLLGPGGERYRYGYDGGGNLSGIEDPLRQNNNFTYEPNFNRLAQVRDARGNALQYAYDTRGNLTAITYADATAERFAYDARGNVVTSTNRRGGVITYAYNPAGQLTSKDYTTTPGLTDFTYAYDLAGNLTNATYWNPQLSTQETLNLQYDPATDRLTRIEYPGGRFFTFDYDAAGRRTRRADQDGHVTAYLYDGLGRLARMTNELGQIIVNYDYDAAGRLSRKTLGNGVFTTYDYNSAGQITNLFNHKPDGSLLSRYEYTYDASGRRTSMKVARGYTFAASQMDARPHPGPLPQERENAGTVSGDSDVLVAVPALSPFEPPDAATAPGASNSATTLDSSSLSPGERAGVRAGQSPLILAASSSGDGTFTYGYDPLGQLTSVTYPNGRVVTYAYDAAGNRTQVTDNGVPTAYSANPLNQYTTVGGTNYLFDADGNLTNQLSTSYIYDSENRLIAVTTPADTWTYTYDAFGNRIAATHNGQTTRYVIDPTGLGNVAAEYDGGGSLIARYEHGFGLLARSDAAGDPAYYTFSAIGHTSELTGPASAVANAYAYDPFGLSLAKTETIPNPFEFVGEYGVMNEANGLEFMRARTYVPGTGRFNEVDPSGFVREVNLYSYARNNLITRIDPAGTDSFDVDDGGPANVPIKPPPVRLPNYYFYPPLTPEQRRQARANIEAFNRKADGLESLLGSGSLAEAAMAIAEMLQPYPYPNHSPYEDTRPSPVVYPPVQRNPNYEVHHSHQVLNFPPIQPPVPSPLENLMELFLRLLRSFDPNDKLGPSGYGNAGYLPAGGVMAYQIRFENQPSATAPAQRVTVTDTLDPNLDLSTFELTEIAFASQTLAIPAGLNHYETRLAFTVTNQTLLPHAGLTAFGSNSIVVDVQAALDVPTRVLTLTLTALDPNTGWYPEDPLLGFLYPNDTNHVGEGSISYLVRSKLGLASGVTITNRADIVFDYNDPIITPLVSNTIDARPPSSYVPPLSSGPGPLTAEFGPAMLVQWSGQDDAGGSGLANYDIYVIEGGTNLFLWLERTTATSAWFRGEPGAPYGFFSIARDNVGNEEAPPIGGFDLAVIVPTNAPVLSDITNRVADVGNVLLITNTVTGTPIGSFIFSLAAPVPFGATINPTNGVLRWTPNCTQASRTHTITVLVTDTGNPNLRDIRTFTVTTRECVVPELGRLVLQTGDSGRVPVNLISTVPLTNLSMTVEVPAGRLTNFSVEPIVAEICASALTPAPHPTFGHPLPSDGSGTGGEGLERGSPEPQHAASPHDAGNALAQSTPQTAAGLETRAPTELYALTFSTCPGQFLIGTQQVAWLHFTAISNQSSAFVPLLLDDTVGRQPDGSEIRNFAPQAGRVVVVGEETLLEAILASNRQPALILYGQPGPDYVIEGKSHWDASLPWQAVWQGAQTNLFQQIQPIGGTNRMMFFHARRSAVIANASLTVRRESDQLVMEWPASAGNCVLQESSSLSPGALWATRAGAAQLIEDRYRMAVPVTFGGNKFYRLRCER